jgi:hypothetical protein
VNERKIRDRRYVERRAGKRGVNVRHTDERPEDTKRVKRGQHERLRQQCCCAAHNHPYGRCLQCPIHGISPPSAVLAPKE